MATVKYYLCKPDKKGKCPVFLVYQMRGKKFKYYTNEKVLPKHWNTKTQRAKSVADATEINDILEHYYAKIKKIERTFRMEGNEDFTLEEVKNKFKENKKKKVGLYDYFDQLIDEFGGSLQPRTLKKYQTVINDLREFQKHTNYRVSFDRINDTFLRKYLTYLYGERKVSQNTAEKKVSTLKTMLKHAKKAKVNVYSDFEDFKVKKVKTKKVFLNYDELMQLYTCDFSKNSRLDKVRDIFCFGAFTGLRFSDIMQLKYSHIHRSTERNWIDFTIVKTRQHLRVPLTKYALEIINKYEKITKNSIEAIGREDNQLFLDREVFPRISSQKMNDYIKEAGEEARLYEPFAVTKYIGTKRIDSDHPKYEILSSHAARRTFTTVGMAKGIRAEVLQKILGHAKIQTTMGYGSTSDKHQHDTLIDAWE